MGPAENRWGRRGGLKVMHGFSVVNMCGGGYGSGWMELLPVILIAGGLLMVVMLIVASRIKSLPPAHVTMELHTEVLPARAHVGGTLVDILSAIARASLAIEGYRLAVRHFVPLDLLLVVVAAGWLLGRGYQRRLREADDRLHRL